MSTKNKTFLELRNGHLETIPKSFRGFVARAFFGSSKVSAIKAKCLDCVGFEEARERIGNCASWRCPLHPHRPYQNRKEKDGNYE